MCASCPTRAATRRPRRRPADELRRVRDLDWAPDRFDWKLSASRRCTSPTTATAAAAEDRRRPHHKNHLNPDHVRWELHRVWVVDADAARRAQRHQAAKSRYYCDEDTWSCVLGDRWDANGQLWCKKLLGDDLRRTRPAGTVIGSFGFIRPAVGRCLCRQPATTKASQYAVRVALSRTASSRPTPWPAKACAEGRERMRLLRVCCWPACWCRRTGGALAADASAARHATDRPSAPARRSARCCSPLAAAGARWSRWASAAHRAALRRRRHELAQSAVPVSVTLTAVRFVDARHGVAVGHGGVVLVHRGRRPELDAPTRRPRSSPRSSSPRSGAASVGDARPLSGSQPTALTSRCSMLVSSWRGARASRSVPTAWRWPPRTAARPGRRWRDRLDNPKGLHLYARPPARRAQSVIAGEAGPVLLQPMMPAAVPAH